MRSMLDAHRLLNRLRSYARDWRNQSFELLTRECALESTQGFFSRWYPAPLTDCIQSTILNLGRF